ncbi:hypothetical protein [Aquimarina sp. RZ0]|uniref:hypothetical protein n=1 Tax=Aquimarina sp. RZ0 TaxID=2607730 RepID=UPI0011F2AD1D|nr:hypothetical protein [Aquimarina sp. RZ0]KAA1244027.1 hypothetical protein F0000_18505 [Aquimarina sp. RZ0]
MNRLNLVLVSCFLFIACNSSQKKQEENKDVTKDQEEKSEAATKQVEREAFIPTDFIVSILSQLQIKPVEVYQELLVQKKMPYDSNSTIVVIPKIAKLDADGTSFSLDSYILVVDSETAVIQQQFYESNATNGWSSDAVRLAEISIDTAKYMVTKDLRAFGVKLLFIGASKVNPYNYNSLSLFVPEKNGLRKILNAYETASFSGEWDTRCEGEFISVDKKLIIQDEQSYGYFDILVKAGMTTTIATEKSVDNCEEKKTDSNYEEILQYKNGSYTTLEKSYVLASKSPCQLQITLKGNQYHIKTTKREQKGTFSIKEGEITFRKLLGDDPKIEIQGTYTENEITIQNYGNAMNSFTLLEECGDQKYLRLIKE